MNKYLKYKIQQTFTLFFTCLFSLVSLGRKKNHWIMFERGTDARDNAYFFYRYIKENHPNIKVYYVINKSSSDFCKISPEDAVNFVSIKACWLLATADKVISTHNWSIISEKGSKIYKIINRKVDFYFLQHGVIYNNLVSLHSSNTYIKLFFTGAEPEYNYISNVFGYTRGVVRYTGLARHDNLHNANLKQQILFMPTWRRNLRYDEEFLESKYFKDWQSIISNEELLRKLEQTNTELIFYVHYEMQKFVKYFKSFSSNVILAKFEDYDVQTLLKESKLLITDYSSVYFDFAYMRKPIVYYQFDSDDFYTMHSQKGYLELKESGFGDVCEKEEEVVESILKVFDNEFEMEPTYKKRAEEFFPLHDTNNCQRIFDCIIEK